nr:PKD domain-containing protein [Candidatus Sigynarchaeum springense]
MMYSSPGSIKALIFTVGLLACAGFIIGMNIDTSIHAPEFLPNHEIDIEDCSSDVNWTVDWGGVLEDTASSCFATDDHVFIVGTTKSFGTAGTADMVLIKLNARTGAMLWNVTWDWYELGQHSNDFGTGIWANDSCVYTCGYSNHVGSTVNRTVVIKWDASTGAKIWERFRGDVTVDTKARACYKANNVISVVAETGIPNLSMMSWRENGDLYSGGSDYGASRAYSLWFDGTYLFRAGEKISQGGHVSRWAHPYVEWDRFNQTNSFTNIKSLHGDGPALFTCGDVLTRWNKDLGSQIWSIPLPNGGSGGQVFTHHNRVYTLSSGGLAKWNTTGSLLWNEPSITGTCLTANHVGLYVVGNTGTGNFTIKMLEETLPILDYSTNPVRVIQYQNIVFDYNGTTGDGIVSYQWNFGDGTANGTGASPPHTFFTYGPVNITITVIDVEGNVITRMAGTLNVERDYVPVPNFSTNETIILVGWSVAFTAGSEGNLPANHTWDFGDGSPVSSERDPVHTYHAPGTYLVTHTVVDVDGDFRTRTTGNEGDIEVQIDTVPVADFYGTPTTFVFNHATLYFAYNGTAGNDVSISNSHYVWNFGDGTGNITTTTNGFHIHDYAAPGNYTVTVTCTDWDGDTSTECKVNYIHVLPELKPNVTIASSMPNPIPNYGFQLYAEGDFGNEPLSYQWQIQDYGANSSFASPYCSFPSLGTYSVNLTVTDWDGDTFTTKSFIEVVPDVVPVANFSANATRVMVGESVLISFTGSPGNLPTTAYWGINNELQIRPIGDLIYSFNSAGIYNITLFVNDANFNMSHMHVENYIVVEIDTIPSGTITCSDARPVTNSLLGFSFAGAGGENAPLSFSWNFGDGSSNQTCQSPTHAFLNPGSYTIVVTIVDRDGDTVVIQRIVVVEDSTSRFFADYGILLVAGGGIAVGALLVVKNRKRLRFKKRRPVDA